jgi:eukaryotic-like serine/threonine-protein kinase
MEEQGAIEPDVKPTLPVGEVVAAKYRIESFLGTGGMAEIYAAANLLTDRRVALKRILPSLATSKEATARFRREALAAGRINHPNVVAIFDVVEHQGSACIVMELLHGETLARRLARTRQLPLIEAVAIVRPAMRGIAAAHRVGVIHRDLKPDNIFLCLDDTGSIRDCKVLDFGVSKFAVADAATADDITLSGNVVGTPEYMAPEQVRSGKNVDRRVDIYALGVVFYEMLAGRPPFVGEHFSGLMLDIMQSPVPPLTTFRPEVPGHLAAVIHRSMDKDPVRRFQDMASFIEAVEEAGREDLNLPMGTPIEGLVTQISLPTPTTPAARLRPAHRRLPDRSTWVLISGLGALTAAIGFRLWRSQHAEPPRYREPVVEARPVSAPTSTPTSPPPPVPEAAAPVALASVSLQSAAEAQVRPPRRRAIATAEVGAPPPRHPAPVRPPRAGKLSIDDF